MKTRWILIWLVSGVVAISGVRIIAGDRLASSSTTSEAIPGLMLAKLANSQRILTGLVSKDFSAIKQGAEGLVHVCDATQWEANSDSVYNQYRTELRRQSFRLVQMAEEKNLDGAAFNYMQTLSACISCHQHCRDVLRIATIPTVSNRVIPIPTSQEEADWSTMPTMRR